MTRPWCSHSADNPFRWIIAYNFAVIVVVQTGQTRHSRLFLLQTNARQTTLQLFNSPVTLQLLREVILILHLNRTFLLQSFCSEIDLCTLHNLPTFIIFYNLIGGSVVVIVVILRHEKWDYILELFLAWSVKKHFIFIVLHDIFFRFRYLVGNVGIFPRLGWYGAQVFQGLVHSLLFGKSFLSDLCDSTMKRCIFCLCNWYNARYFSWLSQCRAECSLLCTDRWWFAAIVVVHSRTYTRLSLLFDDIWLLIILPLSLFFTLNSCLLNFCCFLFLFVSFLFAFVLSLSGHLAVLDVVLDFRGYSWYLLFPCILGLCFCLLLPYDLSLRFTVLSLQCLGLRFTVLSLWLRGFVFSYRANWCIHRFWPYLWFLFTLVIIVIIVRFRAFLDLLALLACCEARLDEWLNDLNDTFAEIAPLVLRTERCSRLRDQVYKDIEDLLVPQGGHDHRLRGFTTFNRFLFLFLL